MNTSPITTITQTSNTDASKAQFRDTASNTSFSTVLTKEIADRNSTDSANSTLQNEISSPSKQDTPPESSSSAKSVDGSKSKDASDTEQSDTDPSAEQILMMAAQLIPVNLQTEVGAPTALPAELSTELSNGLSAANAIDKAMQEVRTQPIDLADITTSAVDTAVVKDKPTINVDFDMALKQATEEQSAQSGSSTKDGLPLSTDQSVQKLATNTTLENSAIPLSGKTIRESGADAIQDSRPDFSASLASLQQAVASHSEVISTSASNKISPEVGTSAWNQSIGQKIVWMVGSEQQSASLSLNPPDLGPMHVVLSISSTQANASFYSPHAEVREALEAAMPKLREMLGDAGIQLGQASVNAGSPQQQSNYAANPTPSMHHSGHTSDIQMTTPQNATSNRRIIKEGLIDTFA
jgi:flagellar hook-length control protein FliK